MSWNYDFKGGTWTPRRGARRRDQLRTRGAARARVAAVRAHSPPKMWSEAKNETRTVTSNWNESKVSSDRRKTAVFCVFFYFFFFFALETVGHSVTSKFYTLPGFLADKQQWVSQVLIKVLTDATKKTNALLRQNVICIFLSRMFSLPLLLSLPALIFHFAALPAQSFPVQL